MSVTVKHNTEEQRFFAEVNGQEIDAELTYSLPEAKTMNFNHTFVDEEYRGMKVAERLAKTGLTYAREHGFRVMLTCAYMIAFVKRHPEYQDLL